MLTWLFDHRFFMPHGHCFLWRPDILWLHVVSDAMIALSYFSIPVTLVYFLSKREDVPFRGVIGLFAAFIILCGTTHIFGIWTLWDPVYALDGVVKAVTAVVSIFTAAVMIPLVPKALSMRSPLALEAANLRLESEVEHRGQIERQLEHAVADLSRSNHELEQFAYVASHDLQEPLRMVSSYTQLLAKRYQGQLDADADEFIAYAVQGAQRMQGLIQALLTYSRAGSETVNITSVACETLLARTLENLAAAIAEAGAQVTHDPLPVVMADALQLEQVLQNLISNALRYRGAEPPRIHVAAVKRDHEWLFSVRDNGIGIAPEDAERIFVIFQRVARDDQEPAGGTGIGLSICKKIVERHGGRIWVEPAPGSGSIFYFTLPDRQHKESP